MHRKLVYLSLLVICGRAFAQDVSMFRGNLQHAGVYESAGVRKFNRVKWQFHTRGMVIGSPGFAGGLVYVGKHRRKLLRNRCPIGRAEMEI